VPQDTSGIAYRVEGTDLSPVFVLSPTAQNLSIVSTITLGTEATTTWSDCSAARYRVSAHEPGAFDGSALPAGSQKGLTVYFPIDASGAGFVFRAELTAELPAPATEMATPTSVTPSIVIPTPVPVEPSVPAEISLLETTTAPDGGSIKISVSIRNYGETPLTISREDASLIQPDGEVLPLAGSIPGLPRELDPGDTATIDLIFARPSTPTTTLKIFTGEYTIEGY